MKRKLTAKVLAVGLALSTIVTGCGGAAKGEESKPVQTGTASEEAQSEGEKPAGAEAQADIGEVPTELTIYTYYADSAIAQVDRALEIMKPDIQNRKKAMGQEPSRAAVSLENSTGVSR